MADERKTHEDCARDFAAGADAVGRLAESMKRARAALDVFEAALSKAKAVFGGG